MEEQSVWLSSFVLWAFVVLAVVLFYWVFKERNIFNPPTKSYQNECFIEQQDFLEKSIQVPLIKPLQPLD